MNIKLTGAGSININGKDFVGRNVIINNGEVVIDGQSVGSPNPPIMVAIVGDVEVVESTSGDVSVTGDVGEVSTQSGDVNCQDVKGGVKTMSGDVTCRGVVGRVKTMSGDVRGL